MARTRGASRRASSAGSAAEIEDVRVGAAGQLDEERIEAGGIRRPRPVGLDDRGIAELLGVVAIEPAWLRLHGYPLCVRRSH